jgi:hypothetical protein
VDEWHSIRIREKNLLKLCFYVYFYRATFLWIKLYKARNTSCTEELKSVVMCSRALGITALNLWMKVLLTHRSIYLQLLRPLINRAEGWLSTGLIFDLCTKFTDEQA